MEDARGTVPGAFLQEMHDPCQKPEVNGLRKASPRLRSREMRRGKRPLDPACDEVWETEGPPTIFKQ